LDSTLTKKTGAPPKKEKAIVAKEVKTGSKESIPSKGI
jgi:hypothetical protein